MQTTTFRLAGPLQRVLMLTIALVCLLSLVSPASAGNTVQVKAGQPIQAAIHAAAPGTRIVVEAGTYHEQITIQKDGIVLVGQNAVLMPPAVPKQNLCSGLAGPKTQAGICVSGANIKLAPYVTEHRKVLSVGRPVADVSVTGFTVRNFTGQNIAVVGAKNARVANNHLFNGGWYGLLTVGSRGTHFMHNDIVSTNTLRFIGICNDDMANTQVSNNRISGYDIGLCIQTPGAVLTHNNVSKCCIGAYIDPGIHNARLTNSHFSALNPLCLKNFPYGAGGVLVSGSVNATVTGNLIEGMKSGGMAAGVGVSDWPDPPTVAMGNKVTGNTLRNNDLDVYLNTTGTGNVVKPNTCSTPASLCS